EDDVLHQLRHPPVADHSTVGRREREVLEHGLAAERAAGVDPESHVADQILEAAAPRDARDIGVRHAHDRRVAKRCRARVAGRPLAHRGGGLARVQPPDQDAVLDEGGVLGWCSLVVERERPAQPGGRAVVSHVEHRPPEAAVPDSVISGRSSCRMVPCEFTYQYSRTSSRYRASVSTIRSLTASMTPLYASSSRFFSAMGTPRTSPSRSSRASAWWGETSAR